MFFTSWIKCKTEGNIFYNIPIFAIINSERNHKRFFFGMMNGFCTLVQLNYWHLFAIKNVFLLETENKKQANTVADMDPLLPQLYSPYGGGGVNGPLQRVLIGLLVPLTFNDIHPTHKRLEARGPTSSYFLPWLSEAAVKFQSPSASLGLRSPLLSQRSGNQGQVRRSTRTSAR